MCPRIKNLKISQNPSKRFKNANVSPAQKTQNLSKFLKIHQNLSKSDVSLKKEHYNCRKNAFGLHAVLKKLHEFVMGNLQHDCETCQNSILFETKP